MLFACIPALARLSCYLLLVRAKNTEPNASKTIAAVATCLATTIFVISGCGGKQAPTPSPASNSAAPSVTKNSPPQWTSFDGPIYYSCASSDIEHQTSGPGPRIQKLNLQTGQFSTISSFPEGGCQIPMPNSPVESAANQPKSFVAQGLRTAFSPDYTKVAANLSNDLAVGYYDLARDGQLVNVTKKAAPPANDFNYHQPSSDGGWFTPDGLFEFHDNLTNDYKFFDPRTLTVVKTSKEPERPHYYNVVVDRGALLTSSLFYKACAGLWLLNDHQYLGVSSTQSLTIADITPIATGDACNRLNTEGTRISPVSTSPPKAPAADATGSKIIFSILSEQTNQLKLYQVNRNNPDQPSLVPVAAADLATKLLVIDWS